MISRLESAGDNCHDALIVVKLIAITANAMGACEGTEMFQLNNALKKAHLFLSICWQFLFVNTYRLCRFHN